MCGPYYSRIQKSDIRLFTIQPRTQDADSTQLINLHLKTFRSPNYPPYVALSYEWGDKTSDQPFICINGHAVPIRKILHDFLLHLQSLSGGTSDLSQSNSPDPVWFWADAISLNQADEVEKSVQVQQMNDIYERAIRVLGWVWGPKGPTSPPQNQLNPDIIASNSAAFLALRRWSPEANPQDRFLRPEDERHLVDLRQLLVLPSYWTRRWIIQELVLPRQVTLIFGTVHIPLAHIQVFFKAKDSFRAALESHRYNKSRLSKEASTSERSEETYRIGVLKYEFSKCPAAKICEYRTARGSLVYSSRPRAERTSWNVALRQLADFRLYEGLRHFINFDCGHPLDILYAIMGLIRPRDRLIVDYSLAPIELIKAIYRQMTTRRPLWRAVRPQLAFLYARFLTSKMHKDLDAKLNSCLGDGSGSPPNFPLGINLAVRRCYFVDNHLSSIDELYDAEHDCNLMRDFGGDKPLKPLRPWPSCEQLEDQHPSLSISPERTSVLENRRDETEADGVIQAELELMSSQWAAELADDLQTWEGQYREDQLRKDLDTALQDGFWDQPSRGPMFWERRLRQRNGVYEFMQGPATSKTRDSSWQTDLGHRWFVAHNSTSMLGRRKVYGVSEFPIERGDEIWQIPGMEMALVLRNADGEECRIVSRAYLYDSLITELKDNRVRTTLLFMEKLAKDEVTGESFTWDCLKSNTTVGEKRVIRLDLAFLLELSR